MLDRVVSGFQSGADIAGILAARSVGLPTSGWMPRGFLTEDGPRPEYATLYGAREHPSPLYPPRTLENVKMADATLWFGRNDSRGFGCTMNACRKVGRPSLVATLAPGSDITPRKVVTWIEAFRFRSLNVAGNRASTSPEGFAEAVEAFLIEVFRAVLAARQEGERP